jgi:cystathionine beta-lyase/cystathionine gamma-synthase
MNNYTINSDNTYTRYKNIHSNILENSLKNLYNCNNISIVNSGMQANFLSIQILINFINKPIINLIYTNELYYESIQLINFIKEQYKNITIHTIDILNDESIIYKFKYDFYNTTNILFIESCTNPFGYIFNFDIIKQLKILSNNLYIICDNSWLSSNIFNPLEYDIDIATVSLTKYYANNMCIQGACIIKSDIIFKNFDIYLRMSGIHNSIFNLKIINTNINSIFNRIKNCSIICKQVLNYLTENNIIIYHPCFENHKSYNLAKKYFKNNMYPSTFLLGFNNNKNIENIIKNLLIFKVEISFGSINTKIDPHVYIKNNIQYLRISLGYEDSFLEICNGLNELFYAINNSFKYKL